MSVIITGMNMPENCRECIFALSNQGGTTDYICMVAHALNKNCHFDKQKDRPKDCPLEENNK